GALHGAPTKRRMVKGITIRARDAQKTRAEEMLASLHESHWLTRKYAVEVLGTLGDPRAVGPLIEALTDEVNDIRQRAYESLIKIGAPSVPAVASLLTHEDDDLRQVASEIIRKVGKPAVEPLTEVMLTRSEERRVGKECRSRWWPYHLKKKKKNQCHLARCRMRGQIRSRFRRLAGAAARLMHRELRSHRHPRDQYQPSIDKCGVAAFRCSA